MSPGPLTKKGLSQARPLNWDTNQKIHVAVRSLAFLSRKREASPFHRTIAARRSEAAYEALEAGWGVGGRSVTPI
ncbi:hypothetical protein OE88DRAFT_1665428 [Heliocybe sulcata]|uniref:Uncharacterized protein n=1 Tax=Heliocybe sulcata TaxID=5364 RepID=A0A5C3MVN1_9AGAM|nr:hypothetical protein OE88DRAFT_1665428 [Heliocybe sulcata]